ncbi:MAG: Ferrichrome-iron receptor precursor, partial [Pseudomonadota bacterium]
MPQPKLPLRPIALCLATLSVSPVLPVLAQEQQLSTVSISAEKESGYIPASTRGATRTDTPIEQIPQSVVVIPRALIEDQGSRNLSDVLRNVSNVTALDARDSNLTGFKIRGFSSATIVDGVATPGIFQNQESLVGIDQVTVIKGPSGGLYGGSQGMNYSTVGGAVVISTAEPGQTPIRKIGVSGGSYQQRGAHFDFNQPVNEVLAVRLTGEYSNTDSETKQLYIKRTALLPSILLTPNADTKIVLRLRDVKNETLDYQGLPRASAGSPDVINGINRSLFISASSMPPSTNDMRGANLQWTQRLNDQWRFGLTVARNTLELNETGAFAASVIDAFVGPFFGYQFGLANQD